MTDDVETIRVWLREAVRRDGLRATARAVGMSATGLRGVVAGSRLEERTVLLLRRWAVQAEAEGLMDGVPVDPAAVEAAVELLLRAVSPTVRAQLVEILPRRSTGARESVPPPAPEPQIAEDRDRVEELAEAAESMLWVWDGLVAPLLRRQSRKVGSAQAERLRDAVEAWRRLQAQASGSPDGGEGQSPLRRRALRGSAPLRQRT